MSVSDFSVGDRRSVYFIQDVDGIGPIKIGVAALPDMHIRAIQRMSSLRLRLLGVIRGVGQGEETRLHRLFAEDRIHGEWFVPTLTIRAYIREHSDRVIDGIVYQYSQLEGWPWHVIEDLRRDMVKGEQECAAEVAAWDELLWLRAISPSATTPAEALRMLDGSTTESDDAP